jgi:Fe-S-cluster containining protein
VVFECGDCDKCEHELYGSFFPGEEWKLKFFKGAVFQREGVWFLDDCPFYKGGKCTVHEEPWRPIQCQIYPCYLNDDGSIGIDYEGCPNAHLVDAEFLKDVKALISNLNLSKEELKKWLTIVGKYSVVSEKT